MADNVSTARVLEGLTLLDDILDYYRDGMGSVDADADAERLRRTMHDLKAAWFERRARASTLAHERAGLRAIVAAASPKPWPVEAIPDDERVIIYDPEQPLQARFDVAYRYIWALRADVANLRAEVARLTAALEQVSKHANAE